MALLPAVIPQIPEARSEVVPARLARKVAPLFGVPWPESPLGATTWVTDFTRVTLSEIARGAPLPTRAQAKPLAAGVGDEGWAIVDRVGVAAEKASLPNEIANATLNRFGPDTKAAVVLTAVNQLLEPLSAAIQESIPLLVDDAGAPLPAGLRLAGWACAVVEVFRSQPALFAAGIRARAIQRPLTAVWTVPVAPSAVDEPLTRCEISAPWTTAAPVQPRDLDLVDASFGCLGLLPEAASSRVPGESLHEIVVGQLLYRLLDVGTLRDASHLWISARGPGQLAVEALLTPASIVDRFVRQALRGMSIARPLARAAAGQDAHGPETDGPETDGRRADGGLRPGDGGAEPEVEGLDDARRLPAVPDPALLAERPLLARRAAVIMVLGAIRQVHSSDRAVEVARETLVDRLEALRSCVAAMLPADDPVRAVATCRIDLTSLQLLRHDLANDLREVLARLEGSTRGCVAAFDSGILDRGAAAEILSAAAVELDVVGTTSAACESGGLPHPDVLHEQVRELWGHWLRMVEAQEVPRGGRPSADLLGYHLHNYAAFLARHESAEHDLTAAVVLFENVVLPAREKFLKDTGLFDPLRRSLQMCTTATTYLAESAVARGDVDTAKRWAALGRRLISRALADPSTWSMIDKETDRSCRFALRAAPALIVAAELGVVGGQLDNGASGGVDDLGVAADLRAAARLLGVAHRWVASAIGMPERFVRNAEIEAWSARLDRLRAA